MDASITAKIRADRSDFKRGLDAAKADSRKFRAETLRDFADVKKGLSFGGTIQEFKKLEGNMTAVKSAAQSAAVFMSQFQKETTRARVEAEQASAAAARMGIRPMGTEITGLKRRAGAPAARAEADAALWADPSGAFGAAAEKTRVRIDGLTRSTLTANQAMMQSGGGATNAGMGMLMLSQGIDDAQYGFKGIVNNIAPLAESLGAGAGLAGALTIAAVGFNLLGDAAKKAWDDMTGETEYQRLMEQNAELQAAHEKRLTTMQELARQSGEYASQSGQWLAEQRGRERDADDAKHAAATQRMELEQELARARTKESGQNELLQKQAAERLAAERRFYEERVGNFERQGITGDSDANRAGLNALKAEMAALQLKPDLSGREKQRMAELPGLISGQEANISSAESARAADLKKLEEVKAQQEQQAIRDRIADTQTLREGWETAKRLWKPTQKALTDFFDTTTAEAEKQKRAAEIAAAKEKAAAEADAARRRERALLQVQTLRAGGKTKEADALQSQLDLSDRTAQLRKMGFSEAEAAAMAAQGQRNTSGRTRRRGGITSTPGSMNSADFRRLHGDGGMASGGWKLDEEQNGIGFDFSQQRTPAALARGSAANRRAAMGNTISPEATRLDTLIKKMDELIAASEKPVAEKMKPARKTGGG